MNTGNMSQHIAHHVHDQFPIICLRPKKERNDTASWNKTEIPKICRLVRTSIDDCVKD